MELKKKIIVEDNEMNIKLLSGTIHADWSSIHSWNCLDTIDACIFFRGKFFIYRLLTALISAVWLCILTVRIRWKNIEYENDYAPGSVVMPGYSRLPFRFAEIDLWYR